MCRNLNMSISLLTIALRLSLLSQVALGGGPPPCPTKGDAKSWEAFRNYAADTLLSISDLLVMYENPKFIKDLKACKVSLTDILPADNPQKACMKNVSELAEGYSSALADDNEKIFTDVPQFLLSPKFIQFVNSGKINDAKEYLKNLSASDPRIPPMTVESFHGSVPVPDLVGDQRLVVKYVDANRTTKWISFAVRAPWETGEANNISVIAHSNNGNSYFKDYKRQLNDNSVSIEARTDQKNCLLCHTRGHNMVAFDRLENGEKNLQRPWTRQELIDRIWSPTDLLVRTANWEKLHAGSKGGVKPMGKNGKPIDPSIFGPGMGLGSDLEESRTDAFIKSCFTDTLKSEDERDFPYKGELEFVLKNADQLETRMNRVRSAMNCGKCHNDNGVGKLPYPVGLTSNFAAHIYSGSMPYNDKFLPESMRLKPADRRVLASCLFKEQYGYPLGGFGDKKNGRIYKYLTGIDCETGKPKGATKINVDPPKPAKSIQRVQ